jgi:Uma2 family endonuclease
MTVVVRRSMTVEAFLAWEERQELRYEFDGFEPVAMTGGTAGHSAIQRNLYVALGTRLRGRACQPYTSDLKIAVAGSIRYPDAFVVCSPVAARATVVADPVVVFEILNPSTTAIDRVVKNEEYRDTPSIQRYVMLEQVRQAATVFSREVNDWVGHVMSGDVLLAMPEIEIEVPLAEVYDGIAFERSADEDAPVTG